MLSLYFFVVGRIMALSNDYETFSQFKDARTLPLRQSKNKAPESQRYRHGWRKCTDGKGSVTQVLFSDLMLRVSKLSTENQELIALELESIISQYEGEVALTEEVDEDGSRP